MNVVRNLFRQKCGSKAITVPSSAALVATVNGDEELRSEWANILGHQLPALPDLDGLLARLSGLLEWIDGPAQRPEARLASVPMSRGDAPIVAPGMQYWGSSSPLEAVRFAGSNRLLVEFDYHGVHRSVEPYSVRRAQTGNVLLYGWELASGHIKAFKLAEMRNVRSTGASFAPRFRVDV